MQPPRGRAQQASESASSETPSIFVSYSRRDEDWKNRILPHLNSLPNRVDVWEDSRIGIGDWLQQILAALNQADVAVCVVSANFLSSNFCRRTEIPALVQAMRSRGLGLVPILVRPCYWGGHDWLADVQIFPRDTKALSIDFNEAHCDAVFGEVAKHIDSHIREQAAGPRGQVLQAFAGDHGEFGAQDGDFTSSQVAGEISVVTVEQAGQFIRADRELRPSHYEGLKERR